jgi:hypothetical protein
LQPGGADLLVVGSQPKLVMPFTIAPEMIR